MGGMMGGPMGGPMGGAPRNPGQPPNKQQLPKLQNPKQL
jgi:hypothetical protein